MAYPYALPTSVILQQCRWIERRNGTVYSIEVVQDILVSSECMHRYEIRMCERLNEVEFMTVRAAEIRITIVYVT